MMPFLVLACPLVRAPKTQNRMTLILLLNLPLSFFSTISFHQKLRNNFRRKLRKNLGLILGENLGKNLGTILGENLGEALGENLG